MTLNEFFAAALKQNIDMFTMNVGDFTDAEFMMRPVPGANHANWQLGHLIAVETGLMSQVGAKMPELPAGFKERYTKETVAIDDASRFATKADLMAMLARARAATIAWVKTAPASQFDAKGPMEFTPTVADVVQMQMIHLTMHWGQLQVLRRKLGRPVMF